MTTRYRLSSTDGGKYPIGNFRLPDVQENPFPHQFHSSPAFSRFELTENGPRRAPPRARRGVAMFDLDVVGNASSYTLHVLRALTADNLDNLCL